MKNNQYMSYKRYILANGIKDSKEAWREYNEKYNALWSSMSHEMQEQHIMATYNTRFTIQF